MSVISDFVQLRLNLVCANVELRVFFGVCGGNNYIPEKRKFSGILCFRQQRSRRRRVTISLLAR